VRTLGSLARKGDEPVHVLWIAFEHGLHGPLPRVARPTADAVLLGEPAQRVPEEDTLHSSVDHEPATNHADTLRRLSNRMRSPFGFVERLAAVQLGDTFNFYREGERAALRRERLVAYLAARSSAPVLLVGEAAGYRGARVSGIPFTAERQLSGAGPAEATATIVHRVLAELGVQGEVLLWNLVPTHPHLPGHPLSNRAPTRREIAGGSPFRAELARGRRVIAVGRLAARALDAPYVRHPAHGGANAFRDGLIAALDA
jgi:uracil-DNA glycosylase